MNIEKDELVDILQEQFDLIEDERPHNFFDRDSFLVVKMAEPKRIEKQSIEKEKPNRSKTYTNSNFDTIF